MTDKLDIQADWGTKQNSSHIKVIGVGGGGSNAVRHMYSEGIVGVDFLICNTDRGHLEQSPIPDKLLLGTGLGAGSRPELATQFAIESKEKIAEFIGKETQMLFITAGMGKGTGTGASPIVAEVAQSMGILTIGVVTTPFRFEGKNKSKTAEKGIEELSKHVDSLIVVQNQNILKCFPDQNIDMAYGYADDVLKNAVKCIAELITVDYKQNVDFNDVKTIMENSGKAMLGIATASGENRVEKVVEEALSCPLLGTTKIENAQNFLFFISYGPEANFTANELDELTEKFYELQDDDAHIIWGNGCDESLGDAIKLSVIITKFGTSSDEIITPNNTVIVQSESESKNIYTTDMKLGGIEIDNHTNITPVAPEPVIETAAGHFSEIVADLEEQNIPMEQCTPLNTPDIVTIQQPVSEMAFQPATTPAPQQIEQSIGVFDNEADFKMITNVPAYERIQTLQSASQTLTETQTYRYQGIFETANDIDEFFTDLSD